MTHIHRRFNPGLVPSIALLFASCGALMNSVTAAPLQDSKQDWSQRVWDSAKNSKFPRLDQLRASFDTMPDASFDKEVLEHFRFFDSRNRENELKANLVRDEAQAEAKVEMLEAQTEGNLSQALLAAVKAQTFSENYNLAFEDSKVQEIIAWAKEEMPKLQESGEWIEAQEIVYRLKTLYSDTNYLKEYDLYDQQLTRISRRVSLLSKYAPRHMHAYRTRRAERLGETAPGEFNENRTDDWEERLRDIDLSMLKKSMKTAAVEHIENERWRPLLAGGLEALSLFASTPALSETFPSLDDEAKVSVWNKYINKELISLKNQTDGDMTSWTLSRLIDRILKANGKTLELPPELIYREFGDGAMYRLDKFSEIMWPDKLRRFEQSTQGNFVGVGIIIRATDTNDIMVVNPTEGGPAYYAGVKPNDLIKEVDGESTAGWSVNDAVDNITGKANTKVVIGLKRESEDELVEVSITRQMIKLPSVFGWWKKQLSAQGKPEWDWFVDSTTRIAYIRLSQFTEDSYRDILQAWNEIERAGGANGLILDLRYNPGGLLISAVQISNLFLEKGMIVSAEDKYGNNSFPPQQASARRAKLAGLPTVVLINKGSASASEIVAGCLQAHGAAVIVGERSYGKGSVQTVHLVSRKAQMKLTTQYYRLPANRRKGEVKGRIVHKRPNQKLWGVDPDILVTMTPKQIEDSFSLRSQADIIPEDEQGLPNPNSDERPDINDMLANGFDPQLEAALLLLQAKALAAFDSNNKHASIR